MGIESSLGEGFFITKIDSQLGSIKRRMANANGLGLLCYRNDGFCRTKIRFCTFWIGGYEILPAAE